jgi:hypothetical protein
MSREEYQTQAERFAKGGNFAAGGRLKQEADRPALRDKRMIKSAVGQHETHDHAGKPKTKLKLKSGGHVMGEKPAHRADKRARGGAMPEKEHGHGAPKGRKSAVNVNIISPAASEGEKKQAAAAGLQMGARMGAAAAPPPRPAGPAMAPPAPRPAMAGAGPGGPPPAPGGATGPMKRGGEVRKRGGKC